MRILAGVDYKCDEQRDSAKIDMSSDHDILYGLRTCVPEKSIMSIDVGYSHRFDTLRGKQDINTNTFR